MGKSWVAFLGLWCWATSGFAQTESDFAWRKAGIAPTGTICLSVEYDLSSSFLLNQSDLHGTGPLPSSSFTSSDTLSSNLIYLRGALPLVASGGFGMEIYALLGGADLDIKGTANKPGSPSQSFDASGKFGFAYGGGARARIALSGFSILGDISVRNSSSSTTFSPLPNANLGLLLGAGGVTQDFDTRFLELSESIYASLTFQAGDLKISPYGGFRLVQTWVDLEGHSTQLNASGNPGQVTTINYKLNQDSVIRVLLGGEVQFSKSFGAFIEFRFVGEFGLTLGVGAKL